MKIKHILIQFDNELHFCQLPLLRGAIIKLSDDDSLYHNHTETGFSYRYPLIQYRQQNGRAALWAAEEGVDHLQRIFDAGNAKVRLGEVELLLEVSRVLPFQTLVQVWNGTFNYHLRRWLPFNAENYGLYVSQPSAAEKIHILERILVGNILSMCKGLGVTIDKAIECVITQVSEPRKERFKGISLMGFDINFVSNITLPPFVGLGKGLSLGFGVCTIIHEQKTNTDTYDRQKPE